MKRSLLLPVLAVFAAGAFAQSLTPAMKVKIESRAAQLKSWGNDPTIVAAVKAHNANPSAAARGMTNEQWKKLSLLDPLVLSFSRGPLGQYLKSKRDPGVSECFVSGADGTKVAFLSKTTAWSHADKDKHRVPMAGKTWIGPPEVDESTGELQVQVGVPVIDGGKPIGSIVVGLKLSKLN